MTWLYMLGARHREARGRCGVKKVKRKAKRPANKGVIACYWCKGSGKVVSLCATCRGAGTLGPQPPQPWEVRR